MSWAAFGMQSLGRLVGNLSDTYGTGDTLREQQRKENESDFLSRERLGIQARVEGFKAAGLHPALAAGANMGNAPTSVVGGSPPIYTGSGPDSPPVRDDNLDRINAANARRAEAEADMAEISAHNAYRTLANQPGNPNPVVDNLPTHRDNLKPGGAVGKGIKVVPNEIISSKGGFEVGTQPGASVIDVPGYGKWSMPSKALTDKLDDAELLKTLAILGLNRGKLWNFVTEDIPWAVKGYLSDLPKPGSGGKTLSNRVRKGPSVPRRQGGAGGSW